jgi:hypothetical protein
MGHKPAGGLKSRTVTYVRAPKAEPRPHAKSVKGVSQIGTSIGNHITGKGKVLRSTVRDIDAGRGYSPPVGPSDNVAAVGVGGSRNIYRTGVQGRHGGVNPGNPRPNAQRHPLDNK